MRFGAFRQGVTYVVHVLHTLRHGADRRSTCCGNSPLYVTQQLHDSAVGASGDIFAFGAVLYEMLSGKKAFHRQSKLDTMVAVDREEPKPLREFV